MRSYRLAVAGFRRGTKETVMVRKTKWTRKEGGKNEEGIKGRVNFSTGIAEQYLLNYVHASQLCKGVYEATELN